MAGGSSASRGTRWPRSGVARRFRRTVPGRPRSLGKGGAGAPPSDLRLGELVVDAEVGVPGGWEPWAEMVGSQYSSWWRKCEGLVRHSLHGLNAVARVGDTTSTCYSERGRGASRPPRTPPRPGPRP